MSKNEVTDHGGVPVDLFCAVLDALDKLYPGRVCDSTINGIIAPLREIDAIGRQLPIGDTKPTPPRPDDDEPQGISAYCVHCGGRNYFFPEDQ